jgi:hypothetical protein
MIEGAASDSNIVGQIKGFNLHTKQFQNAIQLLNEVLKKFAPPSVQNDLRQDASLAPAKTSFTSRIKSATKNVFGVAYRFLNSSVLLKKVDRLFQNVIVAFQIMQARFFLLLNLHSETFNKIKGDFMKSEAFKNDQITDEGDSTLSRSFLDIASPFKDENPPPPPEVKEKAEDTIQSVEKSEVLNSPAAGGARSRPKKRRLRKTLKRRVLGNWRRKLLKLLHSA